MQQLLNLTESTDTLARIGVGNDRSLKNADSGSSEFSRLMLKQTNGDQALQQLAAKIEAYQETAGDEKAGDIERKNVGEPVTRNLWELLQQMQQEGAEVNSQGEKLVNEEMPVDAEGNKLELTDEQLSEMLQELLAKLASAAEGAEVTEGSYAAVMTEAERQKVADQLLAGMTADDKQALQAQLQQMIQVAAQGGNTDSAVEAAGKFISSLLEPMLSKADADKLLVGNEKGLTQALNEAAERALAQLSGDKLPVNELSAEKAVNSPKSTEELATLLKQLEQQVSAQQSKGDKSELSPADQTKLRQFTAELRQILASQNNGAETLNKEESARVERLLTEVKQLLKGRTGQSEKSVESVKASDLVITATDVKAGKEKSVTGDMGAKGAEGKQAVNKPVDSGMPVDVETKLTESIQQGQVFRNNTEALADASTARAIQGQMVSTAQGTVAANESSQANTLQALQRPLDLQQTAASQKLQERINIMMSRNIQRADIRLDPPELGSVQIRLNMSGEQASVQFQVQSAQAREAIETAMPRLREMLEQQGINLADTEVGEQRKEGERTTGGHAGSTEESDDWAVESEIALDEGRVVADGQVDFYV